MKIRISYFTTKNIEISSTTRPQPQPVRFTESDRQESGSTNQPLAQQLCHSSLKKTISALYPGRRLKSKQQKSRPVATRTQIKQISKQRKEWQQLQKESYFSAHPSRPVRSEFLEAIILKDIAEFRSIRNRNSTNSDEGRKQP